MGGREEEGVVGEGGGRRGASRIGKEGEEEEDKGLGKGEG